MSLGWMCPRCARCYGPFVQQCYACGPSVESGTGTNQITITRCRCGTKEVCDHSQSGCPLPERISVTADV